MSDRLTAVSSLSSLFFHFFPHQFPIFSLYGEYSLAATSHSTSIGDSTCRLQLSRCHRSKNRNHNLNHKQTAEDRLNLAMLDLTLYPVSPMLQYDSLLPSPSRSPSPLPRISLLLPFPFPPLCLTRSSPDTSRSLSRCADLWPHSVGFSNWSRSHSNRFEGRSSWRAHP